MTYSKIPVAQSIVYLCLKKGINQVVISPGSRNAPLTISFTKQSEIKAYSVVDERCAAFFALGLAQQKQSPVALVCTSGSALLNYYPAIAEAFYSDIPLVVISADRPAERIDIGDGQTIRQKNVFENHIAYSANLYSEIVATQTSDDLVLAQKIVESRRHNEQEINRALNTAIENKAPVHINVPFYEPLYEVTVHQAKLPIEIVPKSKVNKIDNAELKEYAKSWNTAGKKMVVIGVLPPGAIAQKYLDFLGGRTDVIVFTEKTSNVHHPNFFTRIDNVIGALTDVEFENLKPDLLVTIGGMVVSKKIKSFLRQYQPKQHWHIDPKKAYDTYFCLNRHFETPVNHFFNHFIDLTIEVESQYLPQWLEIRTRKDELHLSYLEKMPWCDFKAFDCIIKSLPHDSILQIGNSSAIRYLQLFDINKTLEVYCNRGTSGIDGSTSTAVGFAVNAIKQTFFITGDLSFFYDSNALWNAYVPNNFRVLLINNSGGGIFRILPNKDKGTQDFETYFETTHQLTAAHLCAMYNWKYVAIFSAKDYKTQSELLTLTSDRPVLFEIFTPREVNDKVLLEYFKFIN